MNASNTRKYMKNTSAAEALLYLENRSPSFFIPNLFFVHLNTRIKLYKNGGKTNHTSNIEMKGLLWILVLFFCLFMNFASWVSNHCEIRLNAQSFLLCYHISIRRIVRRVSMEMHVFQIKYWQHNSMQFSITESTASSVICAVWSNELRRELILCRMSFKHQKSHHFGVQRFHFKWDRNK